MQQARREAAKLRREVKHGSSKKGIEEHVAYLYGKVETIIEYYASSNGISQSSLASGVASLLRGKESR